MKLPKSYEPSQYEEDIYALWEKSEAFVPKNSGGKGSYSIVVPPPNANGDLHLGHGLTLALEDIAIRYHRMKGEAALFLPGADHAGFETQVVYEKKLAQEGKSRFDFTRDELYNQIWDFVALNQANFETQLRKLGASVDWTRFTYTLDDKIIKRAYATFKKMWDDKLIYRGERLVNYCTHHRTGFADIEVSYEDAKTPLYYLKYGPFELATTRPETKFGDTAVAVNPKDDRYKQYVGNVITVQGVNGPFDIQVIADDMVDMEFGTGVVKITPAHDFNDWEVAQRHNLPAVRVINHDGTMNERAGRFRGLSVPEARKEVVKALKDMDLLVKVDENYQNRVGKCYKCGTVIEPMLMEQWFIDTQPLAQPAIRALRDDKIKFYPESKKQQLITYLKGLRDWNISRQIAWGIPIPAFQNMDDSDDWIYDERIEQAIIEVNGKKYKRDPDVFDTWFSSASWPYATMDFPNGEDYKQFYPLSLMETASDILYPWVSRMIMFGLYNTGDVPFKSVYLHGLILDEHGAKMSKSKGNVISPMEPLQEFGSDAFRMGISADESPAGMRPYDRSKFVGARNFANKLWNVARFIEDKLGGAAGKPAAKPRTSADYWILNKLNYCIKSVSGALDNYRFAEAYERLYHFVWDDFADWYIEISKSETNREVLAYVLETILKLAHPFAPFVSETIWQTLYESSDNLLIASQWPEATKTDEKAAKEFDSIRDIVSEIRFIHSATKRGGLTLYHTGDSFIAQHTDVIKNLAKLKQITEVTDGRGLNLTSTKTRCWLDIDQDGIRHFLDQLKGRRDEQSMAVKRLEERLANKSYVKNAPEHLVDETKRQLEEAKNQLAKLSSEHDRFAGS